MNEEKEIICCQSETNRNAKSKALAVREGVTSAIKRISPHSSLYSIVLKHGFCAQHYTATHQYVPEQFGSCKHTERPEM